MLTLRTLPSCYAWRDNHVHELNYNAAQKPIYAYTSI
jgi:hypothetical protein